MRTARTYSLAYTKHRMALYKRRSVTWIVVAALSGLALGGCIDFIVFTDGETLFTDSPLQTVSFAVMVLCLIGIVVGSIVGGISLPEYLWWRKYRRRFRRPVRR